MCIKTQKVTKHILWYLLYDLRGFEHMHLLRRPIVHMMRLLARGYARCENWTLTQKLNGITKFIAKKFITVT